METDKKVRGLRLASLLAFYFYNGYNRTMTFSVKGGQDMITLSLIILALAVIICLFLLIAGVVTVAWPLLLLIVLMLIDITIAKALFGRKGGKKKEK